GLVVLNFGHPLTEAQRGAIQALTGQQIETLLELKCQFDHQRSFAEQARELLDTLPLKPAEWQGLPILINPPSLAPIACTVLAELHGRMGYFPPIIRLRPTTTMPPQFEVAEIINLQAVRDAARNKR
ncbi:MAG: CRISPR-associated protein Csx15, partial [Thermoguttaceae bacterium]|nr:CRISPR-associated protein Csx15 [Thermoguttaceae bacterium]MDW8038108.1 CRISPR-associated protein Csx15 [Thermoguttaceae bacterium]